MAIARKCDVCGKFYEEYNTKRDKKNTNGFMFLNLLDNQNYHDHDPYDCCPECMTSIRNYVNALRGKKPGSYFKATDSDESANLPERSETEETDQDPDDGKPWSFDQMSRYR